MGRCDRHEKLCKGVKGMERHKIYVKVRKAWKDMERRERHGNVCKSGNVCTGVKRAERRIM